MKIRFSKPDADGVVTAKVTVEVKIVPGVVGGMRQWFVTRNGVTLGSWSTLKIAKNNLGTDIRL